MSVSAEIYWATELSVDAASRTLAERLKDCHLRYATDEPAEPIVYRQAPDSPESTPGTPVTRFPEGIGAGVEDRASWPATTPGKTLVSVTAGGPVNQVEACGLKSVVQSLQVTGRELPTAPTPPT